MEEINARLWFHEQRGLDAVKFIIEHDFIRGWEVFEERVLNFVASNFNNVHKSLLRYIKWANDTVDANDVTRRTDTWWSIKNMIQEKLRLVEVSRANLTEVDNAYKTGEPLLTYRLTLNRRYDMSYISLELLQKGAGRQNEYFRALYKGLRESEEALNRLIQIGETFVANGTFDEVEFLAATNLYIKGCRAYNYRVFLVKDRIVLKPNRYIDEIIATFQQKKQTLLTDFENIQKRMITIENMIENQISKIWTNVHDVMELAIDYEVNISSNKTYLATVATSTKMDDDMRNLKIQFNELRSRARELSDYWVQFSNSYIDMYQNMLNEKSTMPFYNMLKEDLTDMIANVSREDFHYENFNYLFRNRKDIDLRTRNKEDLWYLMNIDFPTTNVTALSMKLEVEFDRLRSSCDIGAVLQDRDEMFLQRFNELSESLLAFLHQNVMNQQFYRENFMQLDVFMKELSYEEITQQPAYDLPKLLSDVGGSMGLFIGGSALSVFEFFDVIFHNTARVLFNR